MQIKAYQSYRMECSPLYGLSSRRKLAGLLGVTEPELQSLTAGAPLYNEWDERKPNGGFRHIESPSKPLKIVQGKMAKYLGRIDPPDFLYCPVRARSYVTNAKRHIGHRIVRTIDIQNYYTNTLKRRVYWFFHSRMKCSTDVAAIIADLATIDGHLATGSPLSPIMSYFSHIDMWEEIHGLVQAAGCTMTVYMDDLTISGDAVPNKLMWEIRKKINRNGLAYHKEKHFRSGVSEITGVIVKQDRLALPHRHHRKLFELRELMRKTTNKDELVKLNNQLRGRKGQARQVFQGN